MKLVFLLHPNVRRVIFRIIFCQYFEFYSHNNWASFAVCWFSWSSIVKNSMVKAEICVNVTLYLTFLGRHQNYISLFVRQKFVIRTFFFFTAEYWCYPCELIDSAKSLRNKLRIWLGVNDEDLCFAVRPSYILKVKGCLCGVDVIWLTWFISNKPYTKPSWTINHLHQSFSFLLHVV